MADDQVVTNIVARADFSDLIANVRRVTTTLAAMQQQIGSSNKVLSAQINALNRSFGDTLRSTGQFSTHFVSLANDVETFGKRLDGGKLKLRDYFSTLQTHTRTSGGLIRDLARQQVQLQNAILQPLGRNAEGLMQFNVHIPQGLDKIKSSGALARQEMQILNRVMQEGAGQLINWGKNTQWAGRQLTVGLTVPIAAFGAAASKAFREADAELVRLTKVYGGLAATSATELAKVRSDVTKTATELAKAYGASFKDTIALAADIAATGKQGNELLKSTQETTRLSILGEVDRQDAMKTTLALQSAFKQNTTELAESINFLNAVENQTSTTLQDLTEAIPKAGPVVKGLGGDVKDLALFLVAMKEGGINATEGANALKSALASIINPTKVAKGMFNDMGISLEGIVNGNAGDVKGMILELQAALDKLNPLQKQQAIEQLFGKFQFARMSALFENLGKQGSQTLQVMDLMKASSADLAKVADRELKQVTESASGKYRRAVEGLKADLAGIGDEFLKIQTFFVNLVDGIVKFINKLPAPVKTILTFLAGLTAVTGPLIMLTGVLANFLGYVIKGAFHLKALFKGGEGWKLLTPEILAAQQAGSLIEKTFYSDAKAALALAEALQVLSAGMTSIQSKMTQGVISVQPMLSTVAGTIIRPPGDDGGGGGGGLPRIVDPRNPLVGPAGTRASAHMVPRSGMSAEERAAQTIHSFLPAPIPVNQAIGANPQIFAAGDLPSVPGLTTISGKAGPVSTGVVASEAAKWHTMVGTLSMMTKQEVAQMKTQLSTTGTVSSEFTQAFGSLLPQMTAIAENAAQQSAVIVAEAKAGTISVETARQRIIQLNIQVEQLMAQATTGTATALGRTAVITGVPTLDQPVVDPKTGKSNMRELFKKSGTKSFVDDLARLMGVRTWGAGYSTHTTIPIRRNAGGPVYLSGGSSTPIVPGPNVDKDVVPALLTPGEFVVNRKATMANLPLLQAINGMGSSGNRLNVGSGGPLAGLQRGHISNDLSAFMFYMDADTNQRMRSTGKGITGFEIARSLATLKKRTGMHPTAILNELIKRMGGDTRHVQLVYNAILQDLMSAENRGRVFGGGSPFRFEDLAEKHLTIFKDSKLPGGGNVYDELKRIKTFRDPKTGRSTGLMRDGIKYGTGNALLDEKGRPIVRSLLGTSSGFRGSIIDSLFAHSLGPNPDKPGRSVESHGRASTFLGMPLTKTGSKWSVPKTTAEIVAAAFTSRYRFPRVNSGGMIPGYNSGGIVARGYNDSIFPVGPTTGRPITAAQFEQATGYRTLADAMRASGELPYPTGSAVPTGSVVPTVSQTPQIPRGSGILKGIAGYGGGMLGFMGGSALGSKLSGGSMLGSILGGIAGGAVADAAIKKLTFSVLGLGNASSTSAGKTNLLTKAFRVFASLPGPIQFLSVVAGVGAGIKFINDQIEAHRKIVSAGFGVSEESAKKLGLSYKKVGSEIDEYRKKIELANAAAAANKYATSKEAGAGIDITQQAFDKLVTQTAKQFPTEIKMFNTANEDEALQRAINLKAAYVATGMSVEDANELILAMLENSNKAKIKLDILADQGFSSLDTQAKAAEKTFETFADVITNGNFDQLPDALQTASDSFRELQKSMINTTDKSKELVTSGEAYEKVLQQILNNNELNYEIGSDGLNQILQQNKALKGVISSTDTFAGVLAKVKLATSGIKLDLFNMSSSTAAALSVVIEKQKDFLSSVGGPFADLVAKINETGKITAEQVVKNANKTKESIQAEIKLREKNIQKIKDEADAKKKALDDEIASEDFLTQIQKKQLEYSEALASGDMASAAQAQLDIQSMTGSRQTELAKSAIDDKAAQDIKAEELKIEALNNQIDSLEKNLTNSIKAAESSQKQSATLQSLLDELNILVIGAQDGMDSAEKDRAALLDKKLRNAGFSSLADQYFTKGGGRYEGSMFVEGTDYTGIQSLANKSLNFANGKLIVTDPQVLEILKAMQKGEVYGPKTNFVPSTDKYPFLGQKTTVTKQQLTSGGVGFQKGSIFIDKNNKKWSVEGPLPSQYQNDPNNTLYSVSPVEGKAMGGVIKNFMPGGNVTGPGTGTSDSIPAMLSNGEYVIKADSVKKYGIDTFDALNAQRFAAGGPANTSAMITPSVPYYMADGGSIFKKIMSSAISPFGAAGFGVDILNKIDSYRKNKDLHKWVEASGDGAKWMQYATKNPKAESIYVYDMANRFDAKDRGPIVNQALEYLTGQTGVQFKRATFGMRNDPDVVKLDWSSAKSLIEGSAAGSSEPGSRYVNLVSPRGLNAFTFGRLGGQNTIAHEILHSLNIGEYSYSSTSDNSMFHGHAKNPFNLMFPFATLGFPQFVSKSDTEQLRYLTDFYNYKEKPMGKAMGGLMGYHKGGPVGHRHGRNAKGFSGGMPLLSMPAGSTATVDLNAKPTNASKVADFIFGDLTGINSFNRIINGKAHPLDYAAVLPILGASTKVVNAVGRLGLEMMGVKAGMPGLGSLLPKGSLPYLGAKTSTAIKGSSLVTGLAASKILNPNVTVHAQMPGPKTLSQDTITSIKILEEAIAKTEQDIKDLLSGKYYKDNPWSNPEYKDSAIENLKLSVAKYREQIARSKEVDVPPAFLPALDMYIQRPMFAQGSDFPTIASATSRSSAFSTIPFYRALSLNDMAQIAGWGTVPSRDLLMGMDWIKQHGGRTLDEVPWAGIASRWRAGLAEEIPAGATRHPDVPLSIPDSELYQGLPSRSSMASWPFLEKDLPLKIGESWIPPMHKSITDSLDFAKDIAVSGGTGGGSQSAIARFETTEASRGILDLRGIAEGAGSWKYPDAGEGLFAPWTEYVLKAINKNKYNYTIPGVEGKDPTVTKLIDEYVFEVLGQHTPEGFKPFFKAMGGLIDIPKFEKGINMVPADMLAMLHKNEAVVPANMNPFNPNAQAYSQPSVSYNIAPVINAAQGMDEQAIANMATRQVLAEIKALDARTNASMGRPGMRVIGK